MSHHWRVIRAGAFHGVRAFLKLMAIVAPVYTAITVLRYTPVLTAFAGFTAPLMRHFGLPGEAALALILGNVINLYAGLGAITALRLPAQQLTVLAVMLLLSHSQILETAVFFRMRAKGWLLWAIRLAVSLLAGLGLGRLLVPAAVVAVAPAPGTEMLARMARTPWVGPGPALTDWAFGLADTGWKMLAVLVGIFVALEYARRYGLLERMLTGLNRLTRHIGLSREAGLPWLGGNVFGIVFGGGLIIESTHAHKLSPRQVTLVATFLALSHGLFEDTAIFVVMGANLFWITVPRLLLAILVTWLLSRILREKPASVPTPGHPSPSRRS
ncbi:MAG TPA: hypothetical protein ENN51_02660 [candidate division WOR-3 bacterium]|mgnify:CR=1 FL=1|uniref:Nucleoside transporter/FeoB GTPase Gate domain-containing protein n=1 Tax=candidate division WOR-3 bacterium TaxID=2052148 RepID=A0A7V0T4P9_UNCW3|nr:hypothetical protein [candidate division WOR-3 bacterium]